MRYLFSAIVLPAIISGSIHYGLTSAVPVSKCDPMPEMSAETVSNLEHIQDQYIINLNRNEDVVPLSSAVKEYIKSQEQCPFAKSNNSISRLYESPNGGGAILIGNLDPRAYIWTANKISEYNGSAIIEPNMMLQSATIRTTHNAQWSLSRLNYRNLLPWKDEFTDKTTNWPYHLDNTMLGEGSRIYVLDTGVRASHEEFMVETSRGYTTRVEDGKSFGEDDIGPATEDYDGHGTDVAGAAAGLTLGVAKWATIVPYKVSPYRNNVMLADLQEAVKTALDDFLVTNPKVGVIVISKEPKKSDGLFEAIKKAGENGMHVTFSAGHRDKENILVGCIIPSTGNCIMVGSIDIRDRMWHNSGDCVDIFAPGENVRLPSSFDNKLTVVESGTSIAAPQVAGIIAIIGASEAGTELAKNSEKMKKHILNSAANNKITNMKKDAPNNRILQSPVQGKISLDEIATKSGTAVNDDSDNNSLAGDFIVPTPPKKFLMINFIAWLKYKLT